MSKVQMKISIEGRPVVDFAHDIDFSRRDVSFQVWEFLKNVKTATDGLCAQDFISVDKLNQQANTIEYLRAPVDLLGRRCGNCYQGDMEDDGDDMVMCSHCGLRRGRYPLNWA